MQLSLILREVRRAARLSREGFATIAGAREADVLDWEQGRAVPTRAQLRRIARHVEIDVDDLLADSGPSRDEVVAAAVQVMERGGVRGLSREQICKAARIPATAFDTLFVSRRALLFEVLAWLDRRLCEGCRRSPPRGASLSARLMALLGRLAAHDLAHIELVRACHATAWRSGQDAPLATVCIRQRSAFAELIAGHVRAAVEQREIARCNVASVADLVLAAYAATLRRVRLEDQDTKSLLAALEPQLRLVVNGLASARFRESRSVRSAGRTTKAAKAAVRRAPRTTRSRSGSTR